MTAIQEECVEWASRKQSQLCLFFVHRRFLHSDHAVAGEWPTDTGKEELKPVISSPLQNLLPSGR